MRESDWSSDVCSSDLKMINAEGIVQNLGLQWFPSPLTELVKLLLLSQSMMQRLRYILPYHDPNSSGYIKKLYGGCFMIRKTVLDQLGGFDERFFMYGEDVDFSQRIFAAGWKLYYLSEAWIVHLIGGAGSQASSQFSTLMMCESLSKLMEKHHGRVGRLSYRLVILMGSNVRLFLLALMRFFRFDGSSANQLTRARAKYGAMLRWSLNLQKPLIKP
jgi:GT2 family glycosyltransferase